MHEAKDRNVEVPAGILKFAVQLLGYSFFHAETLNGTYVVWLIVFSGQQVLWCLGNQCTGSCLSFAKMQAWKCRAKNMLGVNILKSGAYIQIDNHLLLGLFFSNNNYMIIVILF